MSRVRRHCTITSLTSCISFRPSLRSKTLFDPLLRRSRVRGGAANYPRRITRMSTPRLPRCTSPTRQRPTFRRLTSREETVICCSDSSHAARRVWTTRARRRNQNWWAPPKNARFHWFYFAYQVYVDRAPPFVQTAAMATVTTAVKTIRSAVIKFLSKYI